MAKADLGRYAQTFHRQELRYLIADPRQVARLLKIGGVLEEYRVATLYLGIGGRLCEKGGPKRRIRTYNEGPMSWLEEKLRRGDVVDKVRAPILWSMLLDLKPWTPLVAVRYERSVLATKSHRITVDRHVQLCDPHFRALGEIPEAVIEVKGEGSAPKAIARLLGDPDRHFSKSKRALAALSEQHLDYRRLPEFTPEDQVLERMERNHG